MQHQELIRQYLQQLNMYLARLTPVEAQEVIREIESHIFDALEQQEAAGQQPDARAILQGFGEPRALAALYVNHLTIGTPLPTGFRAMQKIKRGVSTGLYLTMAIFGFSIALTLLFIAGAKLLIPQSVGVWSDNAGQSIVIGFLAAPLPPGKEILGYALIPVATVLALLIISLTRRVLQVLKHNM